MSQTEEAHVRRSLSHTMQTEEAHDGHKTLMTERDAHARQKTLTSSAELAEGARGPAEGTAGTRDEPVMSFKRDAPSAGFFEWRFHM